MIKFCNEGVDYLEIKNQRLGGVILTMMNLSSHENLLHMNKSWITVLNIKAEIKENIEDSSLI